MRRPPLRRLAVLLVGLGVLAVLVHRVGWREPLAQLAQVRGGWLAAALAAGVLIRVVRGLLWNHYQRSAGYPSPRRRSLLVLLGGDFLGTFFVGTLGSLSRPLLVRLDDPGAPLDANAEAVIVEQALTLVSHAALLLGGGGLLLLHPGVGAAVLLPALAVGLAYAAAVLLGASLLAAPGAAGGAGARALGRLPERLAAPARRAAEPLLRFRADLVGLLSSRRVVLPGLGVQAAINTVLTATHSYCLLRSLDLALPLPLLLVVPTMYLTMANIPLSPGGVGLVEGYGVLLCTALGLGAGPALGLLVLERAVPTLLTLAAGGSALLALGFRRGALAVAGGRAG